MTNDHSPMTTHHSALTTHQLKKMPGKFFLDSFSLSWYKSFSWPIGIDNGKRIKDKT